MVKSSAGGSELQKRVVVGVVLICVALACLIAGGPLFWMLASVAGVLMQGEWADLLGASPVDRKRSMFAVSIPLALLSPWAAGPSIVVLGALVICAVAVLAFSRSAALAAGLFYIGLPVTALMFLRGVEGEGLLLAGWALSLVWATDIGAFFVGRSVGGPKLAPRVSPSKTWSGLAGGVLSALAVGYILHLQFGLPSVLAAASGLLAVAAQLGDLFESWLKRRAGVKDSSNLLPGHGGVLDRLDGVVTAAPVAALIVLWMVMG